MNCIPKKPLIIKKKADDIKIHSVNIKHAGDESAKYIDYTSTSTDSGSPPLSTKSITNKNYTNTAEAEARKTIFLSRRNSAKTPVQHSEMLKKDSNNYNMPCSNHSNSTQALPKPQLKKEELSILINESVKNTPTNNDENNNLFAKAKRVKESTMRSTSSISTIMSGSEVSTPDNLFSYNNKLMTNTDNTLRSIFNNKSGCANYSNDGKEGEDKWKKFGYLLSESYEELKAENKQLMKERDTDKKIIEALKEQIEKLKLLLERASFTSRDDKDIDKMQSMIHSQENQIETFENEKELHMRIVQQLNEKLKITKKDLTDTKKELEVQKALNNQLLSQCISKPATKPSPHHVKECAELAEQIICLRTDLDKSQSSLIKAKQQLSTYSQDKQTGSIFGNSRNNSAFVSVEGTLKTTYTDATPMFMGNRRSGSLMSTPKMATVLDTCDNLMTEEEELRCEQIPTPMKFEHKPIKQTTPPPKTHNENNSGEKKFRRNQVSRSSANLRNSSIGNSSIGNSRIPTRMNTSMEERTARSNSAKPPYTLAYKSNFKK